MKIIFFFLVFMSTLILFCKNEPETGLDTGTIRSFGDTVGYAHQAWQMDSLMNRINRVHGRERENILFIQDMPASANWQLVICPHDDYSYAGELYPYVLSNLKTPVVIIFGVAHRARSMGIENKLVFDSFSKWEAPYGPINVSSLRETIMGELPEEMYTVNDSLQQVEHSVEALLPFLQYYQPDVQIVSILVPAMNFDRMQAIGTKLATAIHEAAEANHWKWGRDFSMAISNDCVHYGDQGWGGKNYAPFGSDTSGYRQATNYDMNIISECLIDQVEPQRIRRFFEYTVSGDDFREYAWTWCGRYCLPTGLLTAYYLQNFQRQTALFGQMLRYGTSISNPPIPVSDLEMGVTAPADIHHWVGYVAIGYRLR